MFTVTSPFFSSCLSFFLVLVVVLPAFSVAPATGCPFLRLARRASTVTQHVGWFSLGVFLMVPLVSQSPICGVVVAGDSTTRVTLGFLQSCHFFGFLWPVLPGLFAPSFRSPCLFFYVGLFSSALRLVWCFLSG